MTSREKKKLNFLSFPSLPQLILEYKTKVQPIFKPLPWFSQLTEATTLFQFETFFLREVDPFHRTCKRGHFTASCLVINPETKKLVLTKHKKLGLWLQLGGHCDGDQDLAQVALKEGEEESGLKNLKFSGKLKIKEHPVPFDFDIHEIPMNKNDPKHFHLDVRFLIETTEEDLKISEESLDLRWFSPEEALELAKDESLKRLIQKYQVISSL